MLKQIDKSHSKTDLINIINSVGVPIVFSHECNKKTIQDKLTELFKENKNLIFDDNVYNINSLKELRIYISNPNPKKTISVKEKQTIMAVCKDIITYCKNKYLIEKSNYKTIKDLHDDMRWICLFGDLPSVRRVCKLMNLNIQKTQQWIPIISPQVKKILDDKERCKNTPSFGIRVANGKFHLHFD
tara:strand:+ start:2322 stop:2879 length:558 start_codon:yes stop_codon:yes gene_type:complete